MPRLSWWAWHELLAETEIRSRDELGELIDNHADLGEVVKAIVEAIESEFAETSFRAQAVGAAPAEQLDGKPE